MLHDRRLGSQRRLVGRAARHARRIETVTCPERHDLRQREAE